MKIIFSGGGTGGHIYPAIALIQELRKKDPSVEILYIGKIHAKEEEICKKENIPFIGIKVRYFYRKITFKNFLTVYEFIKAYRQVRKIIKKYQPDLIIGTGGYVCAPVVYAGYKQKVKTIIHEQNSVPGMTNKFLGKYATKVAISFESSKTFFPSHKVVLTGNPRAQVVSETKWTDKLNFNLDENKKLLLIFMGSLGAKYVNNTIVKSLPYFSKRKDIEVIFVTGESHYDTIISEVNKLNVLSNIFIKPYVDNMPELLKVSDLVICRAGATSLAEITAIGVPAILIPSPFVTNNHQEKNTLDLVSHEAAIMIREKELTEERLVKTVGDLLDNPYDLQKLRVHCRKFGITNSCDRFIDLIKQLI